ncbi:MAG: ribose 5-phosphate isomerase B [Bacteroidota bacterium]
MSKKTIAIGSDHAGYDYKEQIKNYLLKEGYQVIDKGPTSADSVDYPDFIHPVAEEVERQDADLGIIFCGSGNGAAMTANKHQGIRAALAWNKSLAELARQHNDANILSVPARFISEELTEEMVKAFLEAEFEGGRHARRVNKIAVS